MPAALSTAPWVRAPLLLLRRPVVWTAIFTAVFVLGLAAASGVLFVSTIATASMRSQTAADCPESAMPQLRSDATFARTAAANRATVAALRGGSAPPVPYAVDVTEVGVGDTTVTLFSRGGATDHVHRLTPDTGAPGAWLPAGFARKVHAHPGSVLRTDSGTLRVGGIYRDLAPDPFRVSHLPRYWCTWKSLAVQRLDFPVPPLLLVDVATLVRARAPDVQVTAYEPIAGLTITNARAAERSSRAAFAAFGVRPRFGLPVPNSQPDPLSEKIAYADRVQRGLLGSVVPIDVAGTAVALLLVAGAGGYWSSHRSREIRLLTSRGVAPALLGLKAVLETAPAAAAGLVVGVFAARVLVQQVGPAAEFTPHAFALAWLAAGVALVVGLAVVFAIGARAARDVPRTSRRRRVAHAVPWELSLVAFAVWLGHNLLQSSGVIVTRTVITVRPALLVFPIVGATGAVLLVARLLWLSRRLLARLAPRLARAGYLALRRTVHAPAVALGLFVGTALPIALLTYASTVDHGTSSEVTAKYGTNLGAPHALLIIGAHSDKPALHGHGSAVVAYGPTEATLRGGDGISVLGVDTATFADFAFVDDRQRADVSMLHGSAALLIHAGDAPDPTSVRIGATRLAIHVVARDDVFPGLTAGRFPMVVVDRDLLTQVDPTADRRNLVYTTDAQADLARQATLDDGYSIVSEVDPAIRLSNSGLEPVTWIIGYLRALAVLVGVVAVAGLVFALGARTRQRTVAYVMSRRMGLSQGTHVRSLLIELATLVGLGWACGLAAGAAAFALVVTSLDVFPDLPPGARFALPASVLGTTAGVVVLVVTVAALAAHRLAERADPADVLRLE